MKVILLFFVIVTLLSMTWTCLSYNGLEHYINAASYFTNDTSLQNTTTPINTLHVFTIANESTIVHTNIPSNKPFESHINKPTNKPIQKQSNNQPIISTNKPINKHTNPMIKNNDTLPNNTITTTTIAINSSQPIGDIHCSSGTISKYLPKKYCKICCHSLCETCGGRGCGKHGLASLCCINTIIFKQNRYCNTHDPPCQLTLPQYCPAAQIENKTIEKVAFKDPLNKRLNVSYYYYNSSQYKSLSYFQNCTIEKGIAGWSKNSVEHFFYKQLEFDENVKQYQVYDCFKANIFIIPVSFGNAGRNQCGKTHSVKELRLIIKQLTKDITDADSKSCWNINKKSRKYHLIMSGSDKGRQFVPYEWGQLIFADTSLKVMGRVKKKELQLKRCYISYGFVSIVNHLLLHSANWVQMNKTLLIHSTNNSVDLKQYHTNNLPSFHYRNKIKFKNRKYGTFFMGQASEKIPYYENRWNAIKNAKILHDKGEYNMNNDNVWISTPSKKMAKHHLYNECAFDGNYDLSNNASYPCWIDKSVDMLYFQLLSNSKFNLMFRGGDSCSSRFYDAISLDVINIVISDDYMRNCLMGGTYNDKAERINQHIPWNKMFLQIDINKLLEFKKTPIKSIQKVINQYDDTYYDKMLQLIDQYKKYILWDRPDTKSALFFMQSAFEKCY